MPFSRLGPVTGLPRSRTSPAVGVSRPPTIRITVVLPQPDGPTSTTNSPWPMPRSRGSTTGTTPWAPCANDLVSPRNSMKAVPGSAKIAEPASVEQADPLVGDEPDHADGQDAGEHFRRLA